jgi:putative NADH-flavin reductase
MKILIIGSTGFVGSKIVIEALSRGHQITAIARNPEKLPVSPLLNTINVDIFQTETLAQAITGHDAVISAYNPGWGNPDIYNLFLKGSASIQEAVKKSGVRRLLIIGGAGSLFIGGKQIVDLEGFPAEIKPGATAAREYLNIIKTEQDLDWTVLSPPGILEAGERTGKFRIGLDEPVRDEQGKNAISIEDLVVALLDELEKGNHIRQRFTVAY